MPCSKQAGVASPRRECAWSYRDERRYVRSVQGRPRVPCNRTWHLRAMRHERRLLCANTLNNRHRLRRRPPWASAWNAPRTRTAPTRRTRGLRSADRHDAVRSSPNASAPSHRLGKAAPRCERRFSAGTPMRRFVSKTGQDPAGKLLRTELDARLRKCQMFLLARDRGPSLPSWPARVLAGPCSSSAGNGSNEPGPIVEDAGGFRVRRENSWGTTRGELSATTREVSAPGEVFWPRRGRRGKFLDHDAGACPLRSSNSTRSKGSITSPSARR